ncbi:hypothetical protein [Marinisporobacter balticus]|uniref:hypothetical protein n=1 Tax=Marinisporobacter balticus TaxID=2018667 RepID=UPI0010539B1B|nr:hypothetical protein [Marinisporobacter balticus]
MTRKKIMICRIIEQSFVTIIICSNVVSSNGKAGFRELLWSIGVAIVFIGMINYSSKGKYSIYNMNMREATLLIEETLKEKEDKNLAIEIHSSIINTVDINLNQIRDSEMYSDIYKEIKVRLKFIDEKLFPYAGIIYIIFGSLYLGTAVK